MGNLWLQSKFRRNQHATGREDLGVKQMKSNLITLCAALFLLLLAGFQWLRQSDRAKETLGWAVIVIGLLAACEDARWAPVRGF
jgi:hypothetical protein